MTLLAGVLSAHGQTVSLSAVADTYLKSGSPNQNQGSDTFLRIQDSGNNRALVRVNQADVVAAIGQGSLISATLQLYIERNGNNWGTSGRTVEAHRLTADWTELGATWNCGSDTSTGNSQADCSPQWAGGSFDPAVSAIVVHSNGQTGWVNFDVSADVSAFLTGTANFGWLLKKSDETVSGLVEYTARQGTAGQTPRLMLEVGNAPALAITAPTDPVIATATPLITLTYADDGLGLVPSSLHVRLDNTEITASCSIGPSAASCVPAPLAAGAHTISATLSDAAGNVAATSFNFTLLLDAPPQIIILPATGDSFLRQGAPNQNQGALTYLRIRESGDNRALIRFDPAAVVAAVGSGELVSATLQLYVEYNGNNWGTSGRTVEVHRFTSEWTELGATWNCGNDTNTANQQPDCNPQWAGGSFASAVTASMVQTKGRLGWVDFDVSSDVNALLAGTASNGWVIKKADETLAGLVKYTSREGTAGQNPRLVLAVRGTATPTDTPAQAPPVTRAPTTPPTPSLMPTETLTASPTPTYTASTTPTLSATPTETATTALTPTAPPTSTPLPPGAVAGQVFDDATAQPLGGVFVAVLVPGQAETNTSPPTSTITSDDGRYTLPVPAGDHVIMLTKAGYTRSARLLTVSPAGAGRPLDARLTALAPAVTLGRSGGSVTALYRVSTGGTPPDSVTATVEFGVAPDALPDGTQIRLTPLSPQGLIAPLPLGWSALLGVEVDLTSPVPVPAGVLRVPAPLFAPEASLPISVAWWNDTAQQWFGGPTPTEVDGTVEIDVSSFQFIASSLQLALLVPDTLPVAPPAAVEDAPLQGVGAIRTPGDSGSVIANPPVIVTGRGGGAQVLLQMESMTQPLSSGTVFNAALRETYDLRDGREVTGMVSTQEFLGYQVSPMVDGILPMAGALGAYFNLIPSRDFPLSQLRAGRVDIDLSVSQAGSSPLSLVGTEGGTVSGAGGLRLVLPANAMAGTAVIALRPAPPASLPANAAMRADFLGAFEIDVSGGGLDPLADYEVDLGTTVPDGEAMVIGRVVLDDQGPAFVFTALGHGAEGRVVFDACPVGFRSCLSGLTGSGTYVAFAVTAGTALVTGTVGDSSGVRAGISVGCNTVAVTSVSDANGIYLLPVPVGVISTITASDPAHGLSAGGSVVPASSLELPIPLVTLDLFLHATPPQVVQISPAAHAGNVALNATVTVTFSKAIDAASITAASVQLLQLSAISSQPSAGSGGTGVSPVGIRASLSADGKQLLVTPAASLSSNTVYRLALTSDIADIHGSPLTPNTLTPSPLFFSDFTTAPVFKAEALPPNTLRVSLPDSNGEVFVCGGANLAAPGTAVVVQNATSQTTYTANATDANGISGSPACDALFPDRCDSSQPGSFCSVIDAALGDRVQVEVEDVLHNTETLDAGLMRDERTGTTAVGPSGGTVLAADDAHYRLDVSVGAFENVAMITITPLTADDLPHTADTTLRFIAGVDVDLGGQKALKELHLSTPAPTFATPDDQYVATQVVTVRGFEELTVVDTASIDPATDLLRTDSPPFDGVLETGKYAMHAASRCLAWVSGFVSTATAFTGRAFNNAAFIPGQVDLPFFLHGSLTQRFTMPVPCNESVDLSLSTITGEEIDHVSLSTAPRKGEFIFLDETQGQGLFADHTPPTVIETQTSVPDNAANVGHDAEVSVPFTEPVLSSSLTSDHLKLICTVFGRETEMKGDWSQSADGKRVFFVPRAGRPRRGLPLGSHCRLMISGVKDQHGNEMPGPFAMEFDTFAPVTIAGEGRVDATSVDVMGWQPTTPPGGAAPVRRQYIALAEGVSYQFDSQGGLLLVDETKLDSPLVVHQQQTPGLDRIVRFLPPEDLHDRAGSVFHGPFLMSLDGTGGPQSNSRFGLWHLFDASSLPALAPLATRIVNHSADSFGFCNSTDPVVLHECNVDFQRVPNDVGVPVSLATSGAQVAYIADTPNIGIEAIQVSDIDRSGGADGVDGVLHGYFHATATLKGWVISSRHDGLLITPPTLLHVSTFPDYPLASPALALTALANWPVDVNRDGTIGADETFDLVVAATRDGQGQSALRVVAVDTEHGRFAPQTMEGTLVLPPGSQPSRLSPDPERRLLYVANGTLGVTVIDFQDPSGTLDDDTMVAGGIPNGIDDRVVANVPLPGGASARDVASDITTDSTSYRVDRSGSVIGYVAAGPDGWFWLDLGPARMEMALVGYATEDSSSTELAEATEVRYFNERATALYQVEVKLPGHLGDLYSTLDVQLHAVAWDGQTASTPPVPRNNPDFPFVTMTLAPTTATVHLTRVPGTNRYTMPRDQNGRFAEVVVASNLPADELHDRMQQKFPGLAYEPIYAGIGTKLHLAATVAAAQLDGRERTIPFEKIDVIVLGIDGLRQDVLYPPAENEVQEPGVDYRIDPQALSGIGQVLGGVPRFGGGVDGNLDRHHLRMRHVSAVFPSITLASWASIFTGQPPSVTGILGNEFFIRPPVPSLPFQRNDGVITFSEGAFDRSLEETAALTPPGGATDLGDPDATAQNQPEALLAPTIFEELRAGPDADFDAAREALRRRFGSDSNGGTLDDMSVTSFNHYARGASRWLTMTDSQQLLFALTRVPGVREGWPLNKIPSDNFVDYLESALRAAPRANPAGGLPIPGDRNSRPFPALSGVYLAGVDHDAHEGHGPTGQRYKSAVSGGLTGTDADGYVRQVVDELRDLGELYNKIFILTADHGHTRITDDPNEFTPCALQVAPGAGTSGGGGGLFGLGSNNWLEAMDLAKKRELETDQNSNLHIWELARIIAQANDLQSAFQARLLVSKKLAGRSSLGDPPLQPDRSTTVTASSATLVAALNGAMVHLYVRPADSADWSAHPTERELGVVAEVLRLALMQGYQFNPDGTRVLAPTANPAFGALSEEDEKDFLATIDLKRLDAPFGSNTGIAAVDFILVRLNGEYVVYNGLEPDPLGTPTPTPTVTLTPTEAPTADPNATDTPAASTNAPTAPPTPAPTIKIRSLPLSFLAGLTNSAGRPRYVDAEKRVAAMNRDDRSGDIVLVMRDDTDVGPPFRFTAGVACKGWHAGLNRSDSYVPLMLSYPGGNRLMLEDLINSVCASASQTDPRDCSQNKVVFELIKGILMEGYFP